VNVGAVTTKLVPAAHGKMAVINSAKGKGFKVCFQCGYSTINDKITNVERVHKTPLGYKCRSTLYGPYSLGHEFETDILRISFQGYSDSRNGFWISLLYALLEGASQSLEIERQDLDGCLYPTYGNKSMPSIILFDDVPGGAGHVRRLANQDGWLNVLNATLERMVQCECGGDVGNASCYGCLRNYRNQFCHDILNRGMVIRFLRTIVD
jgi:ATP-dependent helicase YprA (DUF1998 family)